MAQQVAPATPGTGKCCRDNIYKTSRVNWKSAVSLQKCMQMRMTNEWLGEWVTSWIDHYHHGTTGRSSHTRYWKMLPKHYLQKFTRKLQICPMYQIISFMRCKKNMQVRMTKFACDWVSESANNRLNKPLSQMAKQVAAPTPGTGKCCRDNIYKTLCVRYKSAVCIKL